MLQVLCQLVLPFFCAISGGTVGAVMTIALAGAALGFLPRNFSPAEVYMEIQAQLSWVMYLPFVLV